MNERAPFALDKSRLHFFYLSQIGQFGNRFEEVISFFFVMIFNKFLDNKYLNYFHLIKSVNFEIWICCFLYRYGMNKTFQKEAMLPEAYRGRVLLWFPWGLAVSSGCAGRGRADLLGRLRLSCWERPVALWAAVSWSWRNSTRARPFRVVSCCSSPCIQKNIQRVKF